MINIGIDAIEIDRFKHWKKYSKMRLSKIFSASEIDYCLAIETKSAERFASHFAAKEAFYKAINTLLLNTSLPFLKVCKLVNIKRINKAPILEIDWQAFSPAKNYVSNAGECIERQTSPIAQISLTHSKNMAIAVVIILNI